MKNEWEVKGVKESACAKEQRGKTTDMIEMWDVMERAQQRWSGV